MPFESLHEWSPLMGSAPECMVGVITAPLPADPESGVITIVGTLV